MKKRITITLNEKILKSVDSVVDRIYIRNRSQAVEFLIEKTLGENKIAVILATGPAKNLRIAKTEYRPTAKIKDTSVIELAVKNLRENGFKSIFVIGEQPVLASIFNLIGDGSRYGVEIKFVEDSNPPGTATSLRLLKGNIKNTFLVVFGDIIFNKMDIKKLWAHHFKHPAISTLMVTSSPLTLGGSTVPIKKSPLKVEGNTVIKVFPKLIKPLKELKDSVIIFSSIFIAEPEILEYPGESLENDVFPVLAEKGFLYSYLSSEEEIHIHSKEDAKFVKI
jgi:NDP-sugar pyrophosphorylase family protein